MDPAEGKPPPRLGPKDDRGGHSLRNQGKETIPDSGTRNADTTLLPTTTHAPGSHKQGQHFFLASPHKRRLERLAATQGQDLRHPGQFPGSSMLRLFHRSPYRMYFSLT